jgi:chemotaxis protein MotB
MVKKHTLAHRPSRKHKHEEHTNHEAWAIPYADLLTLLLAFFVVMYAISSVNAGKYRVLSDSLFAAFRGAPRTMQPIQVGEKQVGSGADLQTSIVQQAMLEGQPRSILAVKADPGSSKVTGNPTVEPKVQSIAPKINALSTAASQALQKVADQVEHAMDDLVKDNLVVVRRSDFWIEVEIKTDLLFPSGSAHLGTNAVGVIERLADSLAPFPNNIRVEGYTDNVPIKNLQFYSNWELSAARAGSVVRVLAKRGVDPVRLAVVGYGEQRPVQANDTAQGRNANRRVVIVILSTQLQRKEGDLPEATSASTAGGTDGSAMPSPATLSPSVTALPGEAATPVAAAAGTGFTATSRSAGAAAISAPAAATAVPGDVTLPPPAALPGQLSQTVRLQGPVGQPAPPGRPAPAPQALPTPRSTAPTQQVTPTPRATAPAPQVTPALRGTAPATTSSALPAMQHSSNEPG